MRIRLEDETIILEPVMGNEFKELIISREILLLILQNQRAMMNFLRCYHLHEGTDLWRMVSEPIDETDAAIDQLKEEE